MGMDEFQAVLKARELVRKVKPIAIPVPVELYAQEVGAVIRPQDDMEADEAGYCFESNGKCFICTNAKDRPERQRFTVCHEVAHLRLGLPSQHGSGPWWSYAKRPLAEILCDVFAAELLLPYDLFPSGGGKGEHRHVLDRRSCGALSSLRDGYRLTICGGRQLARGICAFRTGQG